MGLMMMLQGTTAVAEIASALAFLNQIKRSLRFLCRRKKGRWDLSIWLKS
jgi:hypothetical protein